MPIFVKVAADASKFVPEGITIVLPDSPKVIEDPLMRLFYLLLIQSLLKLISYYN